MMRRVLRWWRPLMGAGVVALLLWRIGPAPAVEALERIDGRSLIAASGIGLVSTMCTSWRWVLVARGLGLSLSMLDAFRSSYRSQFLNVSLPAGVVGDVQRGLAHGRATGDLGRAARAVIWERSVGQTVQLCLAVPALLAVPSALRGPVLTVGTGLSMAVMALVLGVLGVLVAVRRRSVVASVVSVVRADVRDGLLAPRVWPAVIGSSVLAAAGHVCTFLIAAHLAGAVASPWELVPLAFLVLLAMAIPVSIAGWGPREGAAAWAFGIAGLGAAQGLATAVIYGGMVLVASLPGAVFLALGLRRPNHPGGAVA